MEARRRYTHTHTQRMRHRAQHRDAGNVGKCRTEQWITVFHYVYIAYANMIEKNELFTHFVTLKNVFDDDFIQMISKALFTYICVPVWRFRM